LLLSCKVFADSLHGGGAFADIRCVARFRRAAVEVYLFIHLLASLSLQSAPKHFVGVAQHLLPYLSAGDAERMCEYARE